MKSFEYYFQAMKKQYKEDKIASEMFDEYKEKMRLSFNKLSFSELAEMDDQIIFVYMGGAIAGIISSEEMYE